MKVSSLGSWRYLRWQMKVSSSKKWLNESSVILIPSVVLPYACPFLCIRVLAKSYTARTGFLPLEDRSPTGPVWQSCPCGTCPATACLLPPFPLLARNIYKGVFFLSLKSSPVNVCFITVWHSVYCIKRWNFFKKSVRCYCRFGRKLYLCTRFREATLLMRRLSPESQWVLW